MPFTLYRILFFRDKGPKRSFRMPLLLLPVLVLLLAAMAASTGFLWVRYLDCMALAERKRQFDRIISRQQSDIFRYQLRVAGAEAGYQRIMEFSPKMRVMLGLVPPPEERIEIQGMGGPQNLPPRALPPHFSRQYMRWQHVHLDELLTRVRLEEVQQQQLMHLVTVQKERLKRVPIIWPAEGRFSSDYGWRKSPFTGNRAYHKGIDIRARTGTPILATANGRIIRASRFSTYGLTVDIDHGDSILTRYAHMSRIKVRKGDTIERGQVIGLVGNTGRSVASHVHYEVHVKGKTTDPMNYIIR